MSPPPPEPDEAGGGGYAFTASPTRPVVASVTKPAEDARGANARKFGALSVAPPPEPEPNTVTIPASVLAEHERRAAEHERRIAELEASASRHSIASSAPPAPLGETTRSASATAASASQGR